MRSVLTAVIAAIEAATVALAVLAVIGVPAVLIWWLGFDLAAEPATVLSTIAAVWQLAHFVPLSISIDAQAALGFGLPPEVVRFGVGLAPLGLTAVTAFLACRAGIRFASRGGVGAWSLLGGAAGFAAAGAVTGGLATPLGVWPLWARVTVPMLVYLVPMSIGFVFRAALNGEDWWTASVHRAQSLVARLSPTVAASLPDRAAEAVRLAGVALLALLGLAALGTAVALLSSYVDVVSLSERLHVDVPGVLLLFVLQLVFLPVAWVWAIAWFAGPGFVVGTATSVSPFEALLGPLPAFPLFGAIPNGWGWAGGFAPALIVVSATVLGALSGGRPVMRRASSLTLLAITITASAIVAIVVMLCAPLASGSLGPGRLSTVGPLVWQTGLYLGLELAFGLSLGAFARRFDVSRSMTLLPAALRPTEDDDLNVTEPITPLAPGTANVRAAASFERAELTEPLEPTKRIEAEEPLETVELAAPEAPAPEPEPAPEAPAPEAQAASEAPSEPDEAVDPLLKAFSWEASNEVEAPAAAPDWRTRLRRRLRRD